MMILKTGQRSGGLADGIAYVVNRVSETKGDFCVGADPDTEIARFDTACKTAQHELELLSVENAIFEAHREMAADPMLTDCVHDKIRTTACCAEVAVLQSADEISAMLAEIDDEYLRARTDDVRDVCCRITRILSGNDTENPFEQMPCGSVVVAEELSPSDTANMDFSRISGIVTAAGSTTSHVAIIARNNGIAFQIGIGCKIAEIKNGDRLLLDGDRGEIIINPDIQIAATFSKRIEKHRIAVQSAFSSAHQPVVTKQGCRVAVMANAGSVEEVRDAITAGADGIGLFRSEFLYMDASDFPDEQMQFEAYRAAVAYCGERPLTVRTLDIGGDKSLPYFSFETEPNPYLGWRAIRISLSRRDLFTTQLRALLRASAYGNLQILFPMITTCEELHEARTVLRNCMDKLTAERQPFNPEIRTGVMVETPAAVLIADRLAAEADFFSIGTNDLTQYIMAADRGNARVDYLCDPMNEAVQRAIAHIIRTADDARIECAMCGELAADAKATTTLLQMGLREFSVGAATVPILKERIRKCE